MQPVVHLQKFPGVAKIEDAEGVLNGIPKIAQSEME